MREHQPTNLWATVSLILLLSCSSLAEEDGFPFMLPKENRRAKYRLRPCKIEYGEKQIEFETVTGREFHFDGSLKQK